MQYQFATERPDYSDLASGRVFYSLSGHPAFPVRLASEVFQRCVAIRKENGLTGPCVLYDPCCGAAYHLSVLACLHGEEIRTLAASDIDENAVQLAQRNLGLLSAKGIEARITEISTMLEQYGKESHQEALTSARRLQKRINALAEDRPIETRVFQANALDREAIRSHLQGASVDIVFSDIPYGQHSQWQAAESSNPLWKMLDGLLEILSPKGLVAIASDKSQKPAHENYKRIDHFQVGKRRVVILQPVF